MILCGCQDWFPTEQAAGLQISKFDSIVSADSINTVCYVLVLLQPCNRWTEGKRAALSLIARCIQQSWASRTARQGPHVAHLKQHAKYVAAHDRTHTAHLRQLFSAPNQLCHNMQTRLQIRLASECQISHRVEHIQTNTLASCTIVLLRVLIEFQRAYGEPETRNIPRGEKAPHGTPFLFSLLPTAHFYEPTEIYIQQMSRNPIYTNGSACEEQLLRVHSY